jgi:hypothetical protein
LSISLRKKKMISLIADKDWASLPSLEEALAQVSRPSRQQVPVQMQYHQLWLRYQRCFHCDSCPQWSQYR